MRNKVYLLAITAFICAIAPNLIAATFIAIERPQGCVFWGVQLIFALFIGFLFIPPWTILLGTISVVLAIVTIQRRDVGGRFFAIVALIIGSLEIIGAGLRLAT